MLELDEMLHAILMIMTFSLADLSQLQGGRPAGLPSVPVAAPQHGTKVAKMARGTVNKKVIERVDTGPAVPRYPPAPRGPGISGRGGSGPRRARGVPPRGRGVGQRGLRVAVTAGGAHLRGRRRSSRGIGPRRAPLCKRKSKKALEGSSGKEAKMAATSKDPKEGSGDDAPAGDPASEVTSPWPSEGDRGSDKSRSNCSSVPGSRPRPSSRSGLR